MARADPDAPGGRGPGPHRPAVPVSQLQPGDLLFYHTDPTDPGYISHVAIYLGNDEMLQAPQTGENVEVVQADLSGSEYAAAPSGSTRPWPRHLAGTSGAWPVSGLAAAPAPVGTRSRVLTNVSGFRPRRRSLSGHWASSGSRHRAALRPACSVRRDQMSHHLLAEPTGETARCRPRCCGAGLVGLGPHHLATNWWPDRRIPVRLMLIASMLVSLVAVGRPAEALIRG